MVYRGGEETARVLAALIEAERGCCPFLDFTLEREERCGWPVGFAPEAKVAAVQLGIVAEGS
jgi:hypothetical protein